MTKRINEGAGHKKMCISNAMEFLQPAYIGH